MPITGTLPTLATPSVSTPNLPTTGQISSVGQLGQQQPISSPTQTTNSGLGSFLANKITQARQQYPGDDNMILQGLLSDNQNNPDPLIQKIKSAWGTDRVNRNNNPIAVAVPLNGENSATQALDKAGIKWTYGDTFPDNPKMSTIKILGDPVAGATTILANSPVIQDWYDTSTGKKVLSQYEIKNNTDFQNASPQIQQAVIAGIKQGEVGSNSGYSATQILDGIVQDNPQSQITYSSAPQTYEGTNIPVSSLGQGGVMKSIGAGLEQTGQQALGGIEGIGHLADVPLKGLASGIQNVKSIAQAATGNLAGAEHTSTAALGLPTIFHHNLGAIPTLGSSSVGQNLGSAAQAAALGVGMGETLPAITSNAIGRGAIMGAIQGTLGGAGQYATSNDRPNLKTPQGVGGLLTSTGQGLVGGALAGGGAAAVTPAMTGESTLTDLFKNKQNSIVNEKVWQMIKDPSLEPNVNKSTMTGTKASVEPTTVHDQQLIEAAKPYVTNDPIQTKTNLQTAVATESQNLESALKGQGGTWSEKTLQGVLNDTKVPLKIKSPDGMVTVKNINNYVMELANNPQVSRDASGGLTMSKLFRQGITTEYGENIWNKDTPDAQYIRNVNRTLNNLTASRLPDGSLPDGTPYQSAMQKISLLSEARDNVEIPKEGKQTSTSALGKTIKIAKPFINKVLPYATGGVISKDLP